MKKIKTYHAAKSAFDQKMVSSIPFKVKRWLLDAGMKLEEGQYDLLQWDFKQKIITLRSEDPLESDFVIVWEGKDDLPSKISANEDWVTDVSNNLVRFVKLEKRIYDILEKLDEEIRFAKRNF